MKFVHTLCFLLAALFLLSSVSIAVAEDDKSDDGPPYTIKEVMIIGHKDGLLKKILADEATQAEKLKLLDLYISMVEADPSKGDLQSWRLLAGQAAVAAAKVAVGREGATAELKEASNCAACHKPHKGK